MVEMAQGNIPFFEKNLKEIIRRSAGRGGWRTRRLESFARKAQVIFSGGVGSGFEDVVMRIAKMAPRSRRS